MKHLTAVLANLPFTAKFALTPLLAVVLIAVVAYAGMHGLHKQVRITDEVVQQDLKSATALSSIAGRVHRVNGTLFRVMTNQAGGASTDTAQQFTALLGDIDRLVADLKAAGQQFAGGRQAQAIDEVIKELSTYRGAVEFVGSMLEIDFNSAVSFLQPFAANYDRMTKLIGDMVGGVVAASEQRAAVAAEDAEASEHVYLIVSAAAVVLTLGVAFPVGRSTARSVRRIADATRGLAAGNRAVDIDALRRKDELGAIVDSLAVFRDAMEATERMKGEQEAMAREAEAVRRRTLGDMARMFETDVQTVIDGLISASHDMRGSADRMANTAKETDRQTGVVVAATDEATSSVERAAVAAQQMSSSINEIARQVGSSVEITRSAVTEVERTNATVEGLTRAAAKIGEVVDLISAIAGQTNLLALNATIEAARAGEAGKGFAVVAQEVKNLAAQTSKATGDIAAQVTAIQSTTGAAVAAIQGVGSTISRINEIAAAVAAAVDEQNAVTGEIANAVQTASGSTRQVSATVGEFAVAATETGKAASVILNTTSDLNHHAEALQHSVREFLDRVNREAMEKRAA